MLLRRRSSRVAMAIVLFALQSLAANVEADSGPAIMDRYATVNGLVKMFDDEKLLERVARNELSVLQNAEIPFEV